MINFFFFDFDGTLCDSAADIRSAWHQSFREFGLGCPGFDRVFRVGPPLPEMARTLFPELPESRREELCAAFRRHYDRSELAETLPYPGIDRALRELKERGRTLAIVTNKRRGPTRRLVVRLGWEPLFSGCYSPDLDPGFPRTKAELLKLALTELRAPREGSVMIGDTAADLRAATAAGCRSAAVLWGYGTPGELRAESPDWLLKSADQWLSLAGESEKTF